MAIQITIDTKLTGQEIIDLLKKKAFGINVRNEIPICGIYKIRNIQNNKVYIGSSFGRKAGIRGRWNQHINDLLRGDHNSIHLQNSWNKYGPENFEFSIIEIIKDEGEEYKDFKNKVIEREQYYINFYQSYNHDKGYNISKEASGGGLALTEELIKLGKTKTKWEDYLKMKDLLINTNTPLKTIARFTGVRPELISNIYHRKVLVDEYKNIEFPIREFKIDKLKKESAKDILKEYNDGVTLSEIAKKYNVSDGVIRNLLLDNNIEIRDSIEACRKPIYQYDMMGNFIKEFESIAQAQEECNIGSGKITACAKGERKSANGFRWSYEKLDSLPLDNILEAIMGRPYNSRNRPVIRYNKNWEPEVIYGSVRSVKDVAGKNYERIREIKKNPEKIIFGYKWRYLDELSEQELLNILELKNNNKIKIIDNIFNSKKKKN